MIEFIKKYGIPIITPIVFIILVLVTRCSVDRILFDQQKKNIKYKNKIVELEKKLGDAEKNKIEHFIQIQNLKTEYSLLGQSFQKLKFKKQKVKVIKINKINYVTKPDYDILDNLYNFSLKLNSKLKDIVETQGKEISEDNIIINTQKEIIGNKDKQIENLELANIRLYRKAKRKFVLVIGGGVNHSGQFGLQITAGYRFF